MKFFNFLFQKTTPVPASTGIKKTSVTNFKSAYKISSKSANEEITLDISTLEKSIAYKQGMLDSSIRKTNQLQRALETRQNKKLTLMAERDDLEVYHQDLTNFLSKGSLIRPPEYVSVKPLTQTLAAVNHDDVEEPMPTTLQGMQMKERQLDDLLAFHQGKRPQLLQEINQADVFIRETSKEINALKEKVRVLLEQLQQRLSRSTAKLELKQYESGNHSPHGSPQSAQYVKTVKTNSSSY